MENENWHHFSGNQKIKKNILRLFDYAKKNIYISCPSIKNFTKLIPIFENVCDREVKINILVSEKPLLNSSSTTSLSTKSSLNRGCFVKIVKKFGPTYAQEIVSWTESLVSNLFSGEGDDGDEKMMVKNMEEKIYKYNQSYIVIDSSILIFGNGVLMFLNRDSLVDDSDRGDTSMVVIGKIDQNFYNQVVLTNWETSGNIDEEEGKEERKNSGLETIYQMIDESNESIYLETSLFLSNKDTENKVADHLVQRLARSYHSDNDHFQCVIIIIQSNNDGDNSNSNSEFPFIESPNYIADKINYTVKYIEDQLEQLSINPKLLRSRIFIGSRIFINRGQLSLLVNNNDQVTMMSCLIQDGKKCLLTSSSISDRSLIYNNELGIVLIDGDGGQVKDLEQSICEHDCQNFSAFFQKCLDNETKFIKRHTFWKNDNDLFNSCKNYDFILQKLLGKVYYT